MMENKHESEINVVRDLIKLLDLTGVVFTFDALHCQKKLSPRSLNRAMTIQLKLKPINQNYTNKQKPHFFQQRAKQTVEHQEKTRDRNSYRQVEVFEPPKNLDPLWIGVGSVIKVERSGTRANQSYQRIGYYLCSLSPQSRRLADGIRGHWLIEREGRWGFPSLSNHAVENQLHWCLDVAFNEDDSRIRSGHAPENMTAREAFGQNASLIAVLALIRHIALNLLSQETSVKVGKKAKRKKSGWDNDYLAKVLAP